MSVTQYYDSNGEIVYHDCDCDAEPPIITNADRIRRMNDMELAELIADNIDCNICKEMHDTEYERCPGSLDEEKGCRAFWLDWLKQEAQT